MTRWPATAPPTLLVMAVTWCLATRGGTDLRDLIATNVVLATAYLLAAPPRCRSAGRSAPQSLSLWAPADAALILWLLVDGPLREGTRLETVRLPCLVILATLTCLTVAVMHTNGLESVLRAFILLGTMHAALAVLTAVHELTTSSGVQRAQALLGNPNDLGVVLVSTSVLTVREWRTTHSLLLAGALAPQVLGVLLTQSRLALLEAVLLLLWVLASRPARWTRWVVAVGLLAASSVLASRFIRSPVDARAYLWMEAIARIARHPIVGAGPVSDIYISSISHGQPTTHAHNEVLQCWVEYGLGGVLLAASTVGLSIREAGRRAPRDPLVLAAALCLIGIGLTDFGLRSTALTLMASTLSSAAFFLQSPRSWMSLSRRT